MKANYKVEHSVLDNPAVLTVVNYPEINVVRFLCFDFKEEKIDNEYTVGKWLIKYKKKC